MTRSEADVAVACCMVDGVERRDIDSAVLGNARAVWVQPVPRTPRAVLLFLDGEHYVRDLGAVAIMQTLHEGGVLADLLPVYVSHVDYPTRWRESFCNPDFGRFLATELLPWVRTEFGVTAETPDALVGLSLTWLAAAYAALDHQKDADWQ